MMNSFLFFFNGGGPIMYPLGILGLAILTLGIYQVWFCISYSLSDDKNIKSYWFEKLINISKTGNPIKSMTMMDSLEICFSKIEEEFMKKVATLRFCGQASTLIGFLGTVTGMVKTFQSVASQGVATPSLLAGGIYEALFTTIFGLILAIIAAGFAHIVSSISRARIQLLETKILKTLDQV